MTPEPLSARPMRHITRYSAGRTGTPLRHLYLGPEYTEHEMMSAVARAGL